MTVIQYEMFIKFSFNFNGDIIALCFVRQTRRVGQKKNLTLSRWGISLKVSHSKKKCYAGRQNFFSISSYSKVAFEENLKNEKTRF